MAAMAEASDVATPPMGLFYRENRPTLGAAFDDIAARATGKTPGNGKKARKR